MGGSRASHGLRVASAAAPFASRWSQRRRPAWPIGPPLRRVATRASESSPTPQLARAAGARSRKTELRSRPFALRRPRADPAPRAPRPRHPRRRHVRRCRHLRRQLRLGREPMRRPRRAAGRRARRRRLFRVERPDDQRRRHHPGQQQPQRPAGRRLHPGHRPRRHLAGAGPQDAHHPRRPRPPARGPHRLRPHWRGAPAAAPARRLERPSGGCRRLRHAQRVQRRLGLERLCPAEGLRLRLPEQGRAQPVPLHRRGSARVPP
jgi:hypothetical protein